jgi:hypothetical protein
VLDVVVVGGGPAGAAIAYRLARLGYRAAIVAAPSTAPGRVEVLAPSIVHLRNALPLTAAIATAHPARETRLLWSGAPETVPAAGGSGLIRRDVFDAALLAATGVQVIRARARAPYRAEGCWHVPLAAGEGRLTARFLIDASGRAGGVFGKPEAAGPATTALVGHWSGATLPAGTMLVEAMADCWCWAAASVEGRLQTAVFVDSRACAGRGHAALTAQAERSLRAGTLFGPVVRGARLLASAIGDATPRYADTPAGADWLRTGDAAVAPDPLSSQGMVAALRLSIQGAAVVHTILAGGDREAALAFFASAVASASARQVRQAAALYAAHRPPDASSFWQMRGAPVSAARDAAPASLRLRAMLSLASEAVLCQAPALVGDRILRVPAVHDPSEGVAVGWIAGIPADRLLAPLRQPISLDCLYEAWSGLLPGSVWGPVLSALLQKGIVQSA